MDPDMTHFMQLQPSPFEMIKDGTKTIELRLFDEKRKKEEDEFKEVARKQYDAEQKREIFKAVCNGMSEEDAKSKLAEYEKQVKQSMGA